MKDPTGDVAALIKNINKIAMELEVDMSGELVGKTLYLEADPACPSNLKIGIGLDVMVHPAYCRLHTCSDAPFCVAEISIQDLSDRTFDVYEPVNSLFMIVEYFVEPLDGERR